MTAGFREAAIVAFTVALIMPLAGDWAHGEESLAAELQISRELQSDNLVPVVGDYVSYEVTMKNIGGSTIEGQRLWTHFVSANGKTDSKATFSIPPIEPDSDTTLHIGPFKMLESGDHCLYLGANNDGDLEMPNHVALNYLPNQCTDSITSYTSAFATLFPVGAVLALAGTVFLGWYIKKRA